jgi:uncharacterized protein YacL
MIVNITRFVFVTAGAFSGYAVSRLIDWTEQIGFPQYLVIFIFVILGWSMGYLIGGIVGREFATVFGRIEERLDDFATTDLLLAASGLLVGLLAALLLSQPLRPLQPAWLAALATATLFMLASYFGIRIALLKRADVARAFPNLSGIQPVETGEGAASPVKLLDTSAVIDGRFIELRALGLLEGEIQVPRFVLAELQTLADSADDMKRARGRRGLDLLTRLHSTEHVVGVFETDYPDIPDADGKLMRLASDIRGTIVTVDYNLTKVAEVREIMVINVNEVASALRPAYLPGEGLRLHIVREGKEQDQGVGYLEDGTMVVVQDGSEHVGHEADTEVTSVLQTSAGRMIFARFMAVAEVERDA